MYSESIKFTMARQKKLAVLLILLCAVVVLINLKDVSQLQDLNNPLSMVSFAKGLTTAQRSYQPSRSCTKEPKFDFSIKPPFSLPDPNCRPVEQVLSSDWVCRLLRFLNSVSPTNKLINVVVSDSNYEEVVLNWLIAALVKTKEPLLNVLVISLDASLHQILSQRNVTSILVEPSSIVYNTPLGYIPTYPLKMTRMTVLRLISHWGFDVANYDPDAVILRNPELFYDQAPTAHIVGGFGVYPPYQHHLWGASLCVGSWLIRSSNLTELFWETLSGVPVNDWRGSDQRKVNLALLIMEMRIELEEDGVDNYNPVTDWRMLKGKQNFRVAILPLDVACRKRGCRDHKRSLYYIWHKGGEATSNAKRGNAEIGGAWFLRDNWKDGDTASELAGLDWLRSVSL